MIIIIDYLVDNIILNLCGGYIIKFTVLYNTVYEVIYIVFSIPPFF